MPDPESTSIPPRSPMSRDVRGPKNPNWKGGRSVASHGYVLIKRPDHHRADTRGYVYEHVLIAEQKIGRALLPSEEVHHDDLNPANNHPDNLIVKASRAEHRAAHRKRTDLRLPAEPNPAIECACGCGASFPRFDATGRPRRFISGHNARKKTMGAKTNISWTDSSWNAIRGCTEVSAGCQNCYAMAMAARFAGPGMAYEGLAEITADGPRWTGKILAIDDKLREPLRWQRPRRIFVNSMSDLFHPGVSTEVVDRHWAVMALARRHTFQVLTKRPLRMARYLNDYAQPGRVIEQAKAMLRDGWIAAPVVLPDGYPDKPLDNVWLGTSVENAEAEARVRHLLDAPAAIRFISAEPLIGPVSLLHTPAPGIHWDYLTGEREAIREKSVTARIDWVIVGGESGPHHRPMDLDWARALRDRCAQAGVAFFYKQAGGLRPGTDATLDGIEHHAFPA